MLEVRRPGRTEFTASGFRVFSCGSDRGGTHGVGIAVEEALCKASRYTTEYVDERLMAMREKEAAPAAAGARKRHFQAGLSFAKTYVGEGCSASAFRSRTRARVAGEIGGNYAATREAHMLKRRSTDG